MRLGDVDVVFLSYYEPDRERNWRALQQVAPAARRVDGVTGFLAAFRRCAQTADSPHFLMVDGDTRLLPSFDADHPLPPLDEASVLTWASRNVINGLVYGNGCLKLWPRARLLEMTSTDGFRRRSGYFIDDIRYERQAGVFSETCPNGSSRQAFVYGFREVLRFCVDAGLRGEFGSSAAARFGHARPVVQTICGVGSDVEHGEWANLGGLQAIRYALHDGDTDVVGDYRSLDNAYARASAECGGQAAAACQSAVDEINAATDLELFWLAPAASAEFKQQSAVRTG